MYQVIRSILVALSENDAEKAHDIALRWGARIQHVAPLLNLIAYLCEEQKYNKPYELCGLTLRNRVGIAAGVDKQGDIPLLLQAFGAGFITVGTVLPYLQVGQPRPRIFRLPEDDALINRMGFNSVGAFEVRGRLSSVRSKIRVPLFISISKMKETPLESAVDDFIQAMATLWDMADAFTLCVSSPNTPGLRELQKDRYLLNLVKTAVSNAAAIATRRREPAKPIFVKWAPFPDLELGEVKPMLDDCKEGGASGLVLANTRMSRPPHLYSTHRNEVGGLSGDPIYLDMLRLIEEVRKLDEKIPIIAAGGINTGARAQRAIQVGANAVKFNTGLIYRGPGLIRQSKLAVAK